MIDIPYVRVSILIGGICITIPLERYSMGITRIIGVLVSYALRFGHFRIRAISTRLFCGLEAAESTPTSLGLPRGLEGRCNNRPFMPSILCAIHF